MPELFEDHPSEEESRTGFWPIYAFPNIEPVGLDGLKEALSEHINPDHVEEMHADFDEEGQYSRILIPGSSFTMDERPGPQIFVWQDAIAQALQYRQLRYGKQEREGVRKETRLFLGSSEGLSPHELGLLRKHKLVQRGGEHDRTPAESTVHEDATQTLEYRSYLRESDANRREQLRKKVMGKIAPEIGNVVVSNVVKILKSQEALPSLFDTPVLAAR